MGDKNLMENILLLEKGVCDLFLHGTIDPPPAASTRPSALRCMNSLGMQDTIYDMMAEKGMVSRQNRRNRKKLIL